MSEEVVKVYSMESCPYCVSAKRLLSQRGIPFQEIIISRDDDQERERLYKVSGMRTVPQIFAGEKLIGGFTDLAALDKKDSLDSLKSL